MLYVILGLLLGCGCVLYVILGSAFEVWLCVVCDIRVCFWGRLYAVCGLKGVFLLFCFGFFAALFDF